MFYDVTFGMEKIDSYSIIGYYAVTYVASTAVI